jgi:hypothetical protein
LDYDEYKNTIKKEVQTASCISYFLNLVLGPQITMSVLRYGNIVHGLSEFVLPIYFINPKGRNKKMCGCKDIITISSQPAYCFSKVMLY